MSRLEYAEAQIKTHMAPYYDPLPFTPIKAKGEWIYAQIRERNGEIDLRRMLLDWHGNFSAIGLGHNHEELVKLEIERLLENRPALISPAFGKTTELAEFLEKISALSGMEMAAPKNAGTEAFDSAVKTARLWGHEVKKIAEGKAKIVVAHDNFHGRSVVATMASTTAKRKEGFGLWEMDRRLKKVPFGDIQALEAAFVPTVAAVILEPIQAEAGVYVPPAGYLTQVRDLCRKNNILFILDEVQSGMGRTGKFFAWQYEGEAARPDGMMLGKLLGGGMEVASVLLLKKEIAELLTPGKEGSTFGGNAKACAIASKTLDILCRPGFLERVERLGEEFMARLKALKSPLIKEVRGKGLLIGVEFIPEAGGAEFLQRELFYRTEILAIARLPHTLGFSPPLTISEHHLLKFGMSRFETFLREMEYANCSRNAPSFEV